MTTAATSEDDAAAKRWLAVLAGREAPSDRATSQAAEAREFFNAQVEALASRPADPVRTAVELQAVLTLAGVQAQVFLLGATARVEADISPSQVDVVKPNSAAWAGPGRAAACWR